MFPDIILINANYAKICTARKYVRLQYINHYWLNGITYCMRENISTWKCPIGPDARRFCSANISTFTVFKIPIERFSC